MTSKAGSHCSDDEFLSIPEDDEFFSIEDMYNRSRDSSSESDIRFDEQTEDVVDNFMVRFARNLAIDSDEFVSDFPRRADMPHVQWSPSSVTARLGRELADVGDDINERYKHQFSTMFHLLDFDKMSSGDAYESFARVTRTLFETGINWGRIVALLCFGYHTAMRLYRRGVSFFSKIVRYLIVFIAKEKIAAWIAEHGGWIAAHTFVTSKSLSTSTFAMVTVAAMASVVIAWYVSRRS